MFEKSPSLRKARKLWIETHLALFEAEVRSVAGPALGLNAAPLPKGPYPALLPRRRSPQCCLKQQSRPAVVNFHNMDNGEPLPCFSSRFLLSPQTDSSLSLDPLSHHHHPLSDPSLVLQSPLLPRPTLHCPVHHHPFSDLHQSRRA